MTTDQRLDVYLAQRGIRRHVVTTVWGGVRGECGSQCSCDTYFDGFDTIGEADAFLDRHIALANLAALSPKQRRRWAKKDARDAKRVALAGAA
jgi:hypothetical protein